MSALAFVALGLLIAAIGLPMALGEVPPNRLYGIRTPRTIADERVWYEANRISGWGLFAAGRITEEQLDAAPSAEAAKTAAAARRAKTPTAGGKRTKGALCWGFAVSRAASTWACSWA